MVVLMERPLPEWNSILSLALNRWIDLLATFRRMLYFRWHTV